MLYVHENNFKTKIRDNYKNEGEKINSFYTTEYKTVKEKLNDIDFSVNANESFINAANIINNYYDKLDDFSKKCKITSQSKFRSTFLEELSTYLFKDNEYVKKGILGFYNKGIYAGMQIDNDMKVRIMKKDVDFCIGKKVKLELDNVKQEIIIPIVAVEVKTYLDGTMFNEVKYSSRLIKNATPNAKTYVLMETNQVGIDKILAARYENNLNEMFVLRNNVNTPISWKVLQEYWLEITNDISNITINKSVKTPGRLINVDENDELKSIIEV